MLYTKLPTSAIDFDDSVNGGVYGKYRLISGNELLTLGACARVTVLALSLTLGTKGYGSRFVVRSFCSLRYREQRSLLRAS